MAIAIPDETIPVVATGDFRADIDTVLILERAEVMKVLLLIGYQPGATFIQIGKREKKMLFKNVAEDLTAEPPIAEDTSFTDARAALLSGGPAFVAYLLSRWEEF